jgi:DNA helicase II / ATP-dependent DNA helicase PcrA
MSTATLTLEQLWNDVGFTPNEHQERAIRHIEGPLYLPAGPGSGKTRVLLWRTVNLIVFHDVRPEEIFLATFTEKAALQLREGLRALLGAVTNHTDAPYDLSKMYVGTLHSLCQRLIADRRFYPKRQRGTRLTLLDELGHYIYMRKKRHWNDITLAAGYLGDANEQINNYFSGKVSPSQHHAVMSCISLFNRFSEECLDPDIALARTTDPHLRALLLMYKRYVASLQPTGAVQRTDFALLQQHALNVLAGFPGATRVFKHVIVDEYQDTNTVQERIYFTLAEGHRNLCVVGDDDQALYRFRGATVENFVEFPGRCEQHLKVTPAKVPLSTNYRSREQIVRFYTMFMEQCNWRKESGGGHYRVIDKNIRPYSTDRCPAVVASTAGKPEDVAIEIAGLVRELIDTSKVENPNQIAFLFPSLKAASVQRMKAALEDEGLLVYAPRAGRFLEVEEAMAMFGLFMQVFGKPSQGVFPGKDYNDYLGWLDQIDLEGKRLMRADPQLAQFVAAQRAELQRVLSDYRILVQVAQRSGWDLKAPYDPGVMKRPLATASGLSDGARRSLTSSYFERIVKQRADEGRAMDLGYVINRATSVDWNVLDLFYRLCGFSHFKAMFDLAQRGEDEGPICNLGLISQYLGRFMDEYMPIITADRLESDRFLRVFFSSYLFALYRRGESEYEDAEDPFPKGRIPFLTIHQSKGLEFPVVVIGNLRKDDNGPQPVERIVHPLLNRQGEPLHRMSEFDIMRMFYVALSRAKNLLVLAHYKGSGQRINPSFQALLNNGGVVRIPSFDVRTVPEAKLESDDLARNYSYTGDYLGYQKCPRQYMVFRRYGFVPSRTQTMMFGSLVHQTLEDLHQYLIAQRSHA